MSEVVLFDRNETEAAVDAKFAEIVGQIEAVDGMLTPEEKHNLELSPVMKEAGTSDQGYRFN